MPNVFTETFAVLKELTLDTLSRFVIATVIFLIGFVIGRFAYNLAKRILSEIGLDKLARTSLGIKFSAEEMISSIIKYAIYFTATLFAINQLGIKNLTFNIIAAGILMVIFISLVLAIRDFLPNVLSGFFIRGRKFSEGDFISVDNAEGKIISIDLVETKIETKGGDILYMPNSFILRGVVRVKRMKKK